MISKVDVHPLIGNRKNSLTCVENTKVVECSYESSTLIMLKQYSFRSFKTFLEQKFVVLASYADEKNRRGVFLLSKKSPSIETQENV